MAAKELKERKKNSREVLCVLCVLLWLENAVQFSLKRFVTNHGQARKREGLNMQKILIGILALGTIALGIVCVIQTKQLRAMQEQVRATEVPRGAEADAQQAQATRLKDLERANQQLERQVQQFASVTTTLRSNETRQSSNVTAWAEQMRAAKQGAGAGGGGEGGEGLFGKDVGDMLGKMMKDPAMREMMREQQKVAINMMYSGLFKDLKLSPDEKDKLKTLLTDSQMRNIENAQGIFGEKKEGADEDVQKLTADSKKQTDADIKALLGGERFAQYEDYQKNIGERMQLDQFKTRLETENLALQDQQSAQLLQIMKEEKAAVPPVIPTDNTEMPRKELMTAENLDKQMAWMEDYNRRVSDRVGQVLTPEQMKQYKDFQDQQLSMQKLGLNMARQMFGSGKTTAPAPPPPAK